MQAIELHTTPGKSIINLLRVIATKIVTDQLPVTSTVNDIIVYVKQQVHTTATTGISDPNNMSLEDTFTEENVIKWTNDV